MFIRGLNEALNKSVVVTSSSTDALIELGSLEESNPYLVKQKALEFARDGKLTNADFKFYFNSTNRKQITDKNDFFVLSSPFQNYKKIFNDSNLAKNPSLGYELPLIKNKFNMDMVAWHLEKTVANQNTKINLINIKKLLMLKYKP